MGFWGTDVFQSDRDLDILDNLCSDLKIESLYCPENPEQTRNLLNDGRLQAEFERLREAERVKAPTVHDWDGINVAIVMLGAAAMSLGADLGDEQKAYMETALRTQLLGMYDEAKRSVLRALKEYRNGTPIEVAGKGLIETANEPSTAQPAAGPGGFAMLNVMDPTFFGGMETIIGDKD